MVHTDTFSPREQEVISLLLEGKSNKQLAFALGISERTVEFHLKNIFIKAGVNSRVELVLKLGKSTGEFTANQVESTVDTVPKGGDNNEWAENEVHPGESVGEVEFAEKAGLAMVQQWFTRYAIIVVLMGFVLIVGGIITRRYSAVVIGVIVAAVAAQHWITSLKKQKE